MKKKLCMLTLLAAASMMVLGGCDSANGNNGDVSASLDEVLDDFSDFADDMEDSNYYMMQIVDLDEDAVLEITTVDESGESQVEETGSQGWFGEGGSTFAQMMEEWNITSIEVKCDEYELLGWKAYENVVEVDEDGFESYVDKELYDGKIFTTEEMMNQELPDDADVHFDTVWNLVCSGCEEKKACGVYYIDDDRYFVCDDCYDSFAYGMGLTE